MNSDSTNHNITACFETQIKIRTNTNFISDSKVPQFYLASFYKLALFLTGQCIDIENTTQLTSNVMKEINQ